ncbi:MAG: VOC family protein [Gammaproteobacteria bacterium]|nr:VOC family protein [Gammaproteobacteria bacterium]
MAERTLDTRNTIIPTKFAHMVLNTRQYEEMKRWYADVLGMEVVVDNGRLCFLTFDDEHHRLALVNLPDLKEQSPEHAGVNHVAYTLADLGSLLATYLRLKANDIVPWWCINHGPTTSMYFRDPDGNDIELQVDNFDDERLTGWMRSEEFRQNPLGVEFDPDLLAEKYCAGEALEVLLEQGSAPKS